MLVLYGVNSKATSYSIMQFLSKSTAISKAVEKTSLHSWLRLILCLLKGNSDIKRKKNGGNWKLQRSQEGLPPGASAAFTGNRVS